MLFEHTVVLVAATRHGSGLALIVGRHHLRRLSPLLLHAYALVSPIRGALWMPLDSARSLMCVVPKKASKAQDWLLGNAFGL